MDYVWLLVLIVGLVLMISAWGWLLWSLHGKRKTPTRTTMESPATPFATDEELLATILRNHPTITPEEAVRHLLWVGGPDLTRLLDRKKLQSPEISLSALTPPAAARCVGEV